MIKAFARAVMATAIGIKVSSDDVRSMQQDHPTSIFARSISKKSVLLDLLYTDNDSQQQSASSAVRNPSDINTSASPHLTDMPVRPVIAQKPLVDSGETLPQSGNSHVEKAKNEGFPSRKK